MRLRWLAPLVVVIGLGACQQPGEPESAPATGAVPVPPAPSDGRAEGSEAEAARAVRLARAHRELGLALEENGDMAGAVEHFAAALAAAPWPLGKGQTLEQTPYGDLARICLGQAPAGAVARACTLVIPSGRFGPEALVDFVVARARARLALGELEGGRDDVDAALEIETGNQEALMLRGRILAGLGEDELALADLRRVVTLGGPLAREARLLRARILARNGAGEQALADLDSLISDSEATELHGRAWRERARVACAFGRAEEAAVGWQMWEQLEPEALAWLEETLRAGGYLDEAEEGGVGPRTVAALRAWTEDGCPEAPDGAPAASSDPKPEADSASDA